MASSKRNTKGPSEPKRIKTEKRRSQRPDSSVAKPGDESFEAVLLQGIRLLLRRRLGTQDVELETQQIITKLRIPTASGCPAEAREIAARVRALIMEYRQQQPTSEEVPAAAVSVAAAVLGTLPARDRRVLIDIYLHGESAELIQQREKLSNSEIAAIRANVRAKVANLWRTQKG